MVEFIYQFFELFATFIEGVLAIFGFNQPCRQKVKYKTKYTLWFEYVNHIYHSHYIIK